MQQATHPKHNRKAFVLTVSLGLITSLLPATLCADLADDIRKREAIRRQQLTADAEALLNEGREAYAKGEYEEAVTKYRSALERLPGGAMTEDRRRVIRRKYRAGPMDGSTRPLPRQTPFFQEYHIVAVM